MLCGTGGDSVEVSLLSTSVAVLMLLAVVQDTDSVGVGVDHLLVSILSTTTAMQEVVPMSMHTQATGIVYSDTEGLLHTA